MTANFRTSASSLIWLAVRLYAGYEWVTAGWHKLTGETPFSAEAYLKGAVAKIIPAANLTPEQLAKFKPITATWWGDFLQNFALPSVKLFNFIVMWGELLVGLALILGFATMFAASMGILMNFSFLMSGSTSSNPYLLVLGFLIILGGATSGRIGVDYWFRPLYRRFMDGRIWKGQGAAGTTASN